MFKQKTGNTLVIRKCVSSCEPDLAGVPRFADSLIGECVNECTQTTTHQFRENTTLTCVARCPDDSFASHTLSYCVAECQGDFFGMYQADGAPICGTQCYTGFFKSYSTRTCVANCPTPLFGDPGEGACLDYCKTDGYYSFIDSDGGKCLK